MPAVPYWKLVRKIQEGTLSENEAKKAFVIKPPSPDSASAAAWLNTENVDTTGVAHLAAGPVDGLARDADEVVRSKLKVALTAPDGSIVAEGDSWFKLPWFYQRTLIDALQESHPVTNIAHWGDTMVEMLKAGEYVPLLKKAKFLLWSGGGNDILGDNFQRSLHFYDTAHQSPKDAPFYVNRFFYQALDAIELEYRSLAANLAGQHPKLKVVVHGYAHARPQQNGMFLGSKMQKLGFDPAYKEDLCNAIIKTMVDAFNERLRAIATAHSNLIYLDLRPLMGKRDWFDELHPKGGNPAHRLADAFRSVLGAPAAAAAKPSKQAAPPAQSRKADAKKAESAPTKAAAPPPAPKSARRSASKPSAPLAKPPAKGRKGPR